MFPPLRTPNLAFRNERNLTFSECSANWGFDLAAVSLGMALADFDRDGDLDVVINNFNAPAALLRNNSSAPRVAVRLQARHEYGSYRRQNPCVGRTCAAKPGDARGGPLSFQ